MGLLYVSWKLRCCLYIPRQYLLSCNSTTLLTKALLVYRNNICTLSYKAAPVSHPLLVHFIILAFETVYCCKLLPNNFHLGFFFSIIFLILHNKLSLPHSLPYAQQPVLSMISQAVLRIYTTIPSCGSCFRSLSMSQETISCESVAKLRKRLYFSFCQKQPTGSVSEEMCSSLADPETVWISDSYLPSVM